MKFRCIINSRNINFIYSLLVPFALFLSPGSLGCNVEGNVKVSDTPLTGRLALISGTSTCHMAVCKLFNIKYVKQKSISIAYNFTLRIFSQGRHFL